MHLGLLLLLSRTISKLAAGACCTGTIRRSQTSLTIFSLQIGGHRRPLHRKSSADY